MSLLLYYIQASGGISGTASGIADTSCVLLGNAAASSSASCNGSVNPADLLGAGGFSCTASGVAGVSVSAIGSAGIAGTSSGVASATNSIFGAFPLAGSIAGVATASASIGEQGDELSATVSGSCSVSGAMSGSGSLSSTSAGIGSAVEVSFVDGDAFGVSFVEASIFVIPNPVDFGHNAASGNLLKLRALVGSTSGTATLTGIRTIASVDSITTRAE